MVNVNTYTSAGGVALSGPLIVAGLGMVTTPDASLQSLLIGGLLIAAGAGVALAREHTKPASEESKKAINAK